MIKRSTIIRVLRGLAAAIEDAPPPTPAKRRPLVIELAPAGTEPPAPFEATPEPDSEMAAANRIIATIYLRRALRRYSPHETIHA